MNWFEKNKLEVKIKLQHIHAYIYFLVMQVRLGQPKGWCGPASNSNKLNRLRIPTGRSRLVGYVQAQPRSWTRDYLEQIQLAVRAGLERGISRFQIRRHGKPKFEKK